MSKTVGRLRNAKKVADKVIHSLVMKTTIPAGMATAGPPLGTMLGQRNINIPVFCKDFNDRTANIKQGIPLPVRVSVNSDRSYNLVIHKPPTSYYLKQAAGVEVASQGNDVCGKVTLRHIYEIAKIKAEDPPNQGLPLDILCKMIIGQSRTLGIEIVDDIDPVEYEQFLEERAIVREARVKELQALREAKMLRTA